MKKLVFVLLVALVVFGLVACGEAPSSQTTTHNPNNSSSSSQLTDSSTTATTHTHSGNTTTQGVDGGSEENSSNNEFQNPNGGDEEFVQGDSITSTTTANPSITTTTNKNTSTSSSKNTTTVTTKPTTTTTTTKKVTTTSNSTTAKSHSFSTATYIKVDMNTHKATGKCTVCGVSATQTEIHSWGSWKYELYPTSTTDGVKYRVCTGCGEEQITVAPKTSVNTSDFPKEVFNLVNAERAKYGLPAFTYYTSAQPSADTRARELMIYFSHNRPDGTKWYTVNGLGNNSQMGAENIARGHGSPEEVVAAFMNSPDHRSNILSTKYTHMVVGYYEGAWVQIFIKPW